MGVTLGSTIAQQDLFDRSFTVAILAHTHRSPEAQCSLAKSSGRSAASLVGHKWLVRILPVTCGRATKLGNRKHIQSRNFPLCANNLGTRPSASKSFQHAVAQEQYVGSDYARDR